MTKAEYLNRLEKSEIYTGSDESWKNQHGDRWKTEKNKYIRSAKNRMKKTLKNK